MQKPCCWEILIHWLLTELLEVSDTQKYPSGILSVREHNQMDILSHVTQVIVTHDLAIFKHLIHNSGAVQSSHTSITPQKELHFYSVHRNTLRISSVVSNLESIESPKRVALEVPI